MKKFGGAVLTLSLGMSSLGFSFEWELEVVDTLGLMGNSICVDSRDYPHILYASHEGQDKYAHWDGSKWVIEYIPYGGEPKLDKMDRLHTATFKDRYLRYAYWNGNDWVVHRKIDGRLFNHFGDYNGDVSLDLDSLDRPCIAYDFGNYWYYIDLLRYARWNGDTWDIQTVDSTQGSDEHPDDQYDDISLKLDSQNRPHIAASFLHGGLIPEVYHDTRYIYRADTGWVVTIVADTSWGISLDIDSLDRPHIAFSCLEGLKYAFWNGSSWESETLGIYPGGFILHLDSKDRPHIAFANPLQYAWWDRSTWHIDTVGGQVGWGNFDMDLDSDDNPHISFYGTHQGQTGIFYAKGTPEGIEESEKLSPLRLKLDVQPNPFRDITTIQLHLPVSGPVRLRCYDASGRLIHIFLDGERKAGSCRVNWDGRDDRDNLLPSGIYWLVLEQGNKRIIKKLVILRQWRQRPYY